MGKNSKRRQAEAQAAAGDNAAPAGGWFLVKGPALRFVLVCGGSMLLFYGVFYTSPEESPALDRFLRAYLGVYASAAAFLFDLLGAESSAVGTTLFLGKGAVQVARGCDAMEPIALFMAAVVAMPVSLRAKLLGLGLGVPCLVLLNLLRIMALALVRTSWPEAFEAAHLTVGQTLYVICTLCLWFAWAVRVSRQRNEPDAASSR